MRIATYNLWNAAANWPQRLAGIAEVLRGLDADIVAAQEAPTQASETVLLEAYLREHTQYPHVLHLPYNETPRGDDRPEGLAFLSKLPLTDEQTNWRDGYDNENSWGARVVVDWQGVSVGLINVHLDWKLADSRERHLVSIVRGMIDAQPADIDILCGDFNDDLDALSLAFLDGGITLHGYRTQWRDLAMEWHAARGETPPVTLDFEHNPRWKAKRITTPSKRFDRIYLRARSLEFEPRTTAFGVFGQHRTNAAGVVPSDHYGLYVDLEQAGLSGTC